MFAYVRKLNTKSTQNKFRKTLLFGFDLQIFREKYSVQFIKIYKISMKKIYFELTVMAFKHCIDKIYALSVYLRLFKFY